MQITSTQLECKNTFNNLSTQVKEKLHQKGFSFLFNFQDYKYYKSQTKTAFNKVQAITDLFILDNINFKSDFSEYVF